MGPTATSATAHVIARTTFVTALRVSETERAPLDVRLDGLEQRVTWVTTCKVQYITRLWL